MNGGFIPGGIALSAVSRSFEYRAQVISVFVLANISVQSPQMLFTFIPEHTCLQDGSIQQRFNVVLE